MALMATVAVVTSDAWFTIVGTPTRRGLGGLRFLALVTCGCVFLQYVLGGLVRHRGMALYEHLGFAFLTALMVIWLAMLAVASGCSWLRRPASALAILVVVQLGLGAGAWITKFGFGGYVAVYGSLLQDVMRTAHVLCGMILFVTTVVLTVRIARVHHSSRGTAGNQFAGRMFDSGLPLPGGAR
jgi:heme A synthase